jgi:hypothetical protein
LPADGRFTPDGFLFDGPPVEGFDGTRPALGRLPLDEGSCDGRLTDPVDGFLLPLPVEGRETLPVEGRETLPVEGRETLPVEGRL